MRLYKLISLYFQSINLKRGEQRRLKTLYYLLFEFISGKATMFPLSNSGSSSSEVVSFDSKAVKMIVFYIAFVSLLFISSPSMTVIMSEAAVLRGSQYGDGGGAGQMSAMMMP